MSENIEIRPGDCFFNVARFSCLRVIHNHGEWCDAMTWRPNGIRGSNIVKVRTKNLLLTPYWRMEAIRVYAGGKSFEFELVDAKPPVCPQIDVSLVEEIDA